MRVHHRAAGPRPDGLPRFVVELEDGERLEAVVQDGSAALPGCRPETHTESATSRDALHGTRGRAAVRGDRALARPAARPRRRGLRRRGPRQHARGAFARRARADANRRVVKLVVPLLLRGFDPILPRGRWWRPRPWSRCSRTEGFSRITLAASLGTIVALALTALLAALSPRWPASPRSRATRRLRSSSRSSASASTWTGSSQGDAFGALGVLDDVTVTQAATVEQLHQSDPSATRADVLRARMSAARTSPRPRTRWSWPTSARRFPTPAALRPGVARRRSSC